MIKIKSKKLKWYKIVIMNLKALAALKRASKLSGAKRAVFLCASNASWSLWCSAKNCAVGVCMFVCVLKFSAFFI